MRRYQIIAPDGRTVDDDEGMDEHGILRDGFRLRTPMMARDGLSDTQRAIADAAARRSFDDSHAKHQPGPIFADRSAAREAYEDARRESEQAWKMLPAPTAVAADRRRKRKKGQARDPFGREAGSWEEEEDSIAASAADGLDAKQRAYAEMCDELCNAWRNPLPGGTDAAAPERRTVAPVPRTMTADEARRIKQEAYDRMCAEDREAWRNPLP
jgi:hypothetical protein